MLPYTFTEHGAVMAAKIIKSSRAVQMSVVVVIFLSSTTFPSKFLDNFAPSPGFPYQN